MPRVLKATEMSKCIGCCTCMIVCAGVNQHSHSLNKSSIRIKTHGGMSGRFFAEVCAACAEPFCAEVCPTGALTPRAGGGAKFDAKKCDGCRKCEEACMVHAISFDADANKPLICRHCGLCARYCPHDCLTLVDVPEPVKVSV